MSHIRTALTIAILVPVGGIAHADTIIDMPTGLTSPGQTVDFGAGVVDGGSAITSPPQFQTSGVEFTTNTNDPWYYRTWVSGYVYMGIQGGHLIRGLATEPTVFSVKFPGPVSEAAFNFKGGPGRNWTMISYRDGVLVESFNFPSRSDPQGTPAFYGFSNSNFDEITFIPIEPGGTDSFEFDNLQFTLLSATDLISNLVDTVISMNIHSGISNALDAKLDTTLRALEDANANNDIAAANAMYAFCSSAEAQRGQKLTDAQADELITAANDVIEILDGSYTLC